MKSKEEIIKELNRLNDYDEKVKSIKSCVSLSDTEKQLLIDDIKLPINHVRGYFEGDDDPNDVNLLTEEEKEKYGIY